jgi:hypothetical protein
MLESLQRIRDELTLLKTDRTTYVKSSDVLPLYDKVVDQVKLLNEIRIDKPQETNQGWAKLSHVNSTAPLTRMSAVDRVLDGCFQLLSLFFMTIGRNNEAPADLYSAKDLVHLASTLDTLRANVKHAERTYSPKLITLLSNRIEVCQELLSNLQSRLDRLGGDLPAIHEKLISILRSISLANTRTKVRVESIVCWSCNTKSSYSFPRQKFRSCKRKQKKSTHKELVESS